MKKIILTAALAITTFGLFAQGSDQLISKKGEMYLPESGDWSVSFSAAPFLTYFGHFLSNAGATSPTVGFLNTNQTIIGKYYVDNQTAYRGLLRIGINSMGQDNLVAQDGSTSNPPAMVVDHAAYAQHFVGLGAGYEKRRGKGRLQGYYGADFMFFLSGSSLTYTYGNAFSSTYQTPTSTQWGGANGITPSGLNVTGVRTLTNTQGSTFGLSLQGFIGFEYFFMPKISVGGEYTWGIMFSSTGQGSMSSEAGNGTSSTTTTTNTGGSSMFSLDSGLNTAWGASTGDLYINFHF
ncbi:MAG TPA: hypothetical protein VNY36_04180 [Bacteroidia bacterium]|jgi:hypothetical protein|nr:hypothetical protein [Bacteroidia bacterium]